MQVILTMQCDEVKAWSLELEARLDRLQPGVCFYPWSKHLELYLQRVTNAVCVKYDALSVLTVRSGTAWNWPGRKNVARLR
jgi:hypothetical protein